MRVKMAGHSHGDGRECSCVLSSSAAAQSLQELDFERGIWSAALDGELGRVSKLLASGVSPSVTDSAGYTALHYASRSGHTAICKLLLDSGAKVNAQTPGGVASLHRAAYCGHGNTVRVLLEHGGDVSLTDSDGRTALHKAAEKGHREIVAILMDVDPSLTVARDNRGLTANDILTKIQST